MSVQLSSSSSHGWKTRDWMAISLQRKIFLFFKIVDQLNSLVVTQERKQETTDPIETTNYQLAEVLEIN